MRDISFLVAPIRDHAFFEQAVLQRQLGDQLLHVTHLALQILDLARGRLAPGVTRQTLLARFQEFLRPAVVQAFGNAFPAAKRRDALLATQTVSSPRRPSRIMRIFSSAEYCLRVLRRMSRTAFSAGDFALMDFCLIFTPRGLR